MTVKIMGRPTQGMHSLISWPKVIKAVESISNLTSNEYINDLYINIEGITIDIGIKDCNTCKIDEERQNNGICNHCIDLDLWKA